MMDNIKIRTGANIQSVLQSTVNFPQAFTELAKNSLQNGATKCEIEIIQEGDSSLIKIIDNGRGFDDVKDSKSNMNDFEKYFTFGNSYDLNASGSGPKLGAMGLGGKISNDKLSKVNSIHWQIHTKNKNGNSFIVDYNPPADVEFLDDYSPSIRQIPSELSAIKTTSGTEVRILNVNENFLKTNFKENVRHELLQFFAHLVISYQKQKKMLEIVFLGETLKFSIDLHGNYRGSITRAFEYENNGNKMNSSFTIRLNEIEGRRIKRQKRNSAIKTIELISEVKICDLHLNDVEIIDKTLAKLSKETGNEIDNANFLGHIHNFIGYVECDDLSKVLDEKGMPAKDLSHHGLRTDHPITIHFLEEVYYVIMKFAYSISQISLRKQKRKKLNKNLIAYNVAKLLAGDYADGLELLSDENMLGINQARKIDKQTENKNDLTLEKVVGNSYEPGKDSATDNTKNVKSETIKNLPNKLSNNKKDVSGAELDEAKEIINNYEFPEEVLFDESIEEPKRYSVYLKYLNEMTDASPWKSTQVEQEVATEIKKYVDATLTKKSTSVNKQSSDVVYINQKSKSSFAKQDNSKQITKSEPLPYTKINIKEFRDLLKTRTKLEQQLDAYVESEQSKKTDEYKNLVKDFNYVVDKLSSIKMFYIVETLDDPLTISEVREYKDGFIIAINDNNIRYRSIEGNSVSIALHVAEAMIKEIILLEDEKIDKTRLDAELSKFYEKHYEELQSINLLTV
jgi:hypothetical protein